MVARASRHRLVELEQVVDGAEHRPFVFHLVKASEQELPEASGVFDLAENGLDDLFAQAIPTSPFSASEFDRHGGDARSFLAPVSAGLGLRVASAAGGDIGSDAATSEMDKIGFAAIARVSGDLFGIGLERAARGSEQRL